MTILSSTRLTINISIQVKIPPDASVIVLSRNQSDKFYQSNFTEELLLELSRMGMYVTYP